MSGLKVRLLVCDLSIFERVGEGGRGGGGRGGKDVVPFRCYVFEYTSVYSLVHDLSHNLRGLASKTSPYRLASP